MCQWEVDLGGLPSFQRSAHAPSSAHGFYTGTSVVVCPLPSRVERASDFFVFAPAVFFAPAFFVVMVLLRRAPCCFCVCIRALTSSAWD